MILTCSAIVLAVDEGGIFKVQNLFGPLCPFAVDVMEKTSHLFTSNLFT